MSSSTPAGAAPAASAAASAASAGPPLPPLPPGPPPPSIMPARAAVGSSSSGSGSGNGNGSRSSSSTAATLNSNGQTSARVAAAAGAVALPRSTGKMTVNGQQYIAVAQAQPQIAALYPAGSGGAARGGGGGNPPATVTSMAASAALPATARGYPAVTRMAPGPAQYLPPYLPQPPPGTGVVGGAGAGGAAAPAAYLPPLAPGPTSVYTSPATRSNNLVHNPQLALKQQRRPVGAQPLPPTLPPTAVGRMPGPQPQVPPGMVPQVAKVGAGLSTAAFRSAPPTLTAQPAPMPTYASSSTTTAQPPSSAASGPFHFTQVHLASGGTSGAGKRTASAAATMAGQPVQPRRQPQPPPKSAAPLQQSPAANTAVASAPPPPVPPSLAAAAVTAAAAAAAAAASARKPAAALSNGHAVPATRGRGGAGGRGGGRGASSAASPVAAGDRPALASAPATISGRGRGAARGTFRGGRGGGRGAAVSGIVAAPAAAAGSPGPGAAATAGGGAPRAAIKGEAPVDILVTVTTSAPNATAAGKAGQQRPAAPAAAAAPATAPPAAGEKRTLRARPQPPAAAAKHTLLDEWLGESDERTAGDAAGGATTADVGKGKRIVQRRPMPARRGASKAAARGGYGAGGALAATTTAAAAAAATAVGGAGTAALASRGGHASHAAASTTKRGSGRGSRRTSVFKKRIEDQPSAVATQTFRRRSRAELLAAREAAQDQQQRECGAGGGPGGQGEPHFELTYDPATLEDLRDLLGVRPLPTGPEPGPEQKLAELKQALRDLNEAVRAWDSAQAGVFLLPVDTKIAPNYYDIIKHPMDLSIIAAKIEDVAYKSAWDYMDDMRLMLDNALSFNRPGSFHHRYAIRLRNWWAARVECMMVQTLANHRYCCGKHRLLSAEVYRCRGGTCFIQHDATYYAYQYSPEERFVYCQTHFSKLAETFTLPRYNSTETDEEVVLRKADFQKVKHNEPLTPERFINCTKCGRADHEICAQHIGYDGLAYVCISCRAEEDPTSDPIQAAVNYPCDCRENGIMKCDLLKPPPEAAAALAKARTAAVVAGLGPSSSPQPSPEVVIQPAFSPLPSASARVSLPPTEAPSAAATMPSTPISALPPSLSTVNEMQVASPAPTTPGLPPATPTVTMKPSGALVIRLGGKRPEISKAAPAALTCGISRTSSMAPPPPPADHEPVTWMPEPNNCGCKYPIPSCPYRARDLPDTHLAAALRAELEAAEPEVSKKIVIRTASHTRETVETQELFRAMFPNHVESYEYTRKMLLAFYDMGGVDICFFAVIVHEYGPDCAEPNRNRVYISLLDSVKLPKMLLPSKTRTNIYHTIVRGYLRYCGHRGFTYAHIFTCPPRRGQNYIFPFKPDYQREISVTRLRQWYEDLLNECMFRPDPAVIDVMTIAEAFPDVCMTELPYFDGDNWPDIMEDIIRQEDAAAYEASERDSIGRMVARAFLLLYEGWKDVDAPEFSKPDDAGGYYAGFPPATLPMRPRKRRKIETHTASVHERLNTLMRNSQRDFLVVKLMPFAKAPVPDPDDTAEVASSGEYYTIAAFLKQERLEFSTLRHSRFSTACLLYLLLAKNKDLPSRFPDPVPSSAAPMEVDKAANESIDWRHHQQPESPHIPDKLCGAASAASQ